MLVNPFLDKVDLPRPSARRHLSFNYQVSKNLWDSFYLPWTNESLSQPCKWSPSGFKWFGKSFHKAPDNFCFS